MSDLMVIILTMIGVNLTFFGLLASLVFWSVNKIDTDVKAVCSRLDRIDSRLDGHATRIDQLYRMFVDLVQKK